MPNISFALILSDNLKLKFLKLKQAETVIEITGTTDSTTLQLIRDASSVQDCFQARRTNLNNLIKQTETALAERAKQKKPKAEALKIKDEFNKAYKQQVETFEKNLTEKVQGVCKADQELQRQLETNAVKFVVRSLWSYGELVWSVAEVVTGGAAAVPTGGAAAALAVKGLLDFILQVKKLVEDVDTATTSAEEQKGRILKALNDIKTNKANLKQSHVTAAESALAPFGPKILSVENQAKALSGKLDELLDKTENVKFGKKKQKKLAKTVGAMIDTIIKLNTEVANSRKFQQSAKDKIKAAAEGSKKPGYDFKTFIAWVLSTYDSVNGLWEKWSCDSLTNALTILAKEAVEEDEGD